MKKHVHLDTLIAGVLSVIMLFLVTASSLFTYWYFDGKLKKSILDSMDGVVESNLRSAKDLVARVQTCIDLFPDGRSEILSSLLYYDQDLYKTFPHYQRVQYRLENNLKTMVGSLISQSMVLFIVDGDMPISKICTARSPDIVFSEVLSAPQVFVSRYDKFAGEDFYQRARRNGGETQWFTRPENADMLYAAQLITQRRLEYSQVKTYTMGVMVIGFDVEWIREQMSIGNMMREASVFITSGETIIYASDNAYAGKALKNVVGDAVVDDMILDDSARAVCRFEDGDCFEWSVSLGDLTLITLVPQARIQSLVFNSLRTMLIQMTVILLVILVAITLLVKRLISPIEQLSIHMQRKVLQSVLPPPLATRTEEMSALYDSFNDQTRRITQLMDDVRAIDEERRRKDIQLLQAQINPHFVFNTLDSVSCMALISGNDEIAGLLGGLAAIMRYNIKDPEELVPFEVEMHMIMSYVEIQKVRCAEGLDIQLDIASDTLKLVMPKMSVQPLVENAIVHVTGTPCIRLSSRAENGVLFVCVASLGENADAEQIMSHLSGDINMSSRSTGLGIRNVDQRIRMIFGDEYGLHYERDGEWLRAILTLPIDAGD